MKSILKLIKRIFKKKHKVEIYPKKNKKCSNDFFKSDYDNSKSKVESLLK